jgi:hypothetical protein
MWLGSTDIIQSPSLKSGLCTGKIRNSPIDPPKENTLCCWPQWIGRISQAANFGCQNLVLQFIAYPGKQNRIFHASFIDPTRSSFGLALYSKERNSRWLAPQVVLPLSFGFGAFSFVSNND